MELKNYSEKVISSLGILILGLCLYLIFKLSDYGFDFTDEGFSLNRITYPYQLKLTFTHFGKVVDPIFRLLGNDISSLRKLTIFFTYLLGTLLTFSCFIIPFAGNTFLKKDRWFKISNILLISGSSINIISEMKMLTPSYNTICFLGCCLLASTFCILNNEENNYIFVFLISTLAIILLLMSKPTSAILAIVYSLIYSFSLNQKSKIILMSGCLSGLIITLIWLFIAYDNSFSQVIYFIKETFSLYKILNSGHDIQTILNSSYAMSEVKFTQLILLISWTIFNLSIINNKFIKFNSNTFIRKNFSLNFLIFPIILILFFLRLNANFQLAFYISLPFTSLFFFIINKDYRKLVPIKIYFLSLIFTIMPFCYTVGTNRNYWLHSKSAIIFFILGFFIPINYLINYLVNSKEKQRLKASIIVISLISILFTLNSISRLNTYPWRQPHNLFDNEKSITIGNQKSKLKISNEGYEYLSNAKYLIQKNNFEENTPIIDLTGRSPGFIYAIGGRPIQVPWLVGGYVGSKNFTKEILNKVSCKDLNRAWILTQPNERTAIDEEVLLSKNIDLKNENNYEQVYKIDVSKISSRLEKNSFQYLFKPIQNKNQQISCQIPKKIIEKYP